MLTALLYLALAFVVLSAIFHSGVFIYCLVAVATWVAEAWLMSKRGPVWILGLVITVPVTMWAIVHIMAGLAASLSSGLLV